MQKNPEMFILTFICSIIDLGKKNVSPTSFLNENNKK